MLAACSNSPTSRAAAAALTPPPPRGRAPRRVGAPAVPDVEIVVPVYDEAAGLEHSIRRLERFLLGGCPFSWRIVIADNASTDATPEIPRRLARQLPAVGCLRLEAKGRGRALRSAWSTSP